MIGNHIKKDPILSNPKPVGRIEILKSLYITRQIDFQRSNRL